MEGFTVWIKTVGAAITGLASCVFGGFDALIVALIVCMVIDYLTGILAALYRGTLNSKTGFKGIFKKVAILSVVAVSYVVGHAVGHDSVRDMVIGFYIVNEAISILENARRMDVPQSEKFKSVLEQLQNSKER